MGWMARLTLSSSRRPVSSHGFAAFFWLPGGFCRIWMPNAAPLSMNWSTVVMLAVARAAPLAIVMVLLHF